nr:immunoglobulin heavy chain junction region [Mus musculus]NSM04983.1 immunoglobulin heavy chain junction region [Mus musculus]NSM05132.1 immunoglobulin heavy chain junction region [Mus musculus]NSM05250.1 immunoglobulin heavy chain junction region [Mus musculus]NSM05694.1 immunoglobulin heavy chain junction region [Mus musculus]
CTTGGYGHYVDAVDYW